MTPTVAANAVDETIILLAVAVRRRFVIAGFRFRRVVACPDRRKSIGNFRTSLFQATSKKAALRQYLTVLGSIPTEAWSMNPYVAAHGQGGRTSAPMEGHNMKPMKKRNAITVAAIASISFGGAATAAVSANGAGANATRSGRSSDEVVASEVAQSPAKPKVVRVFVDAPASSPVTQPPSSSQQQSSEHETEAQPNPAASQDHSPDNETLGEAPNKSGSDRDNNADNAEHSDEPTTVPEVTTTTGTDGEGHGEDTDHETEDNGDDDNQDHETEDHGDDDNQDHASEDHGGDDNQDHASEDNGGDDN